MPWSLSVSSAVREMEVKQMKGHAEGNPLVYAILAPNKQRRVFG